MYKRQALGDCPLRVRPSVGPGTRGLPSAARPPKPNTDPCAFTSRRQVSPTACKAQAPVPQTPDVPKARNRSRAGKPELHQFVPIRVHSWFKTAPHSCPFVVQYNPLRLSVAIRVHPWQWPARGPLHPWPHPSRSRRYLPLCTRSTHTGFSRYQRTVCSSPLAKSCCGFQPNSLLIFDASIA